MKEDKVTEVCVKLKGNIKDYEHLLKEQNFTPLWKFKIIDIYYKNPEKKLLNDVNNTSVCFRKIENLIKNETVYYAKNLKQISSQYVDNQLISEKEYFALPVNLDIAGFKKVTEITKLDYVFIDGATVLQIQDINKIGLVVKYGNKEYAYLREGGQRKKVIAELKKMGFSVESEIPDPNV